MDHPDATLRPTRSTSGHDNGSEMKKPVVIGIYGIPGSGKSQLLKQLKTKLLERDYLYFEGSEVIDVVTPGGLPAFRNMNKQQKQFYREAAIAMIQEQCKISFRAGIVTGHFMFWSEKNETRGVKGRGTKPNESMRNHNPLFDYDSLSDDDDPFEEGYVLPSSSLLPGSPMSPDSPSVLRRKMNQELSTAYRHSLLQPWKEANEGDMVFTRGDLDTFSHILYLDVAPSVIAKRRSTDTSRVRASESIDHLERWQNTERQQLRVCCRNNGILFMTLNEHLSAPDKVASIVEDFRCHTEERNEALAKTALIPALNSNPYMAKTILLMDADRTLSPDDTGMLLWQMLYAGFPEPRKWVSLSEVFKSPSAYTYTAFRQATLLCEELMDDECYDMYCKSVASNIKLYPSMVALMRRAIKTPGVHVVIVTSGNRRIWNHIIEGWYGISKVTIIGGGRLNDLLVVPPTVKESLAKFLRHSYGAHVIAFGDSPLDIPMLKAANEALVIVGLVPWRSSSMDLELEKAITHDGLRAWQVLLPDTANPRLDFQRLPEIKLNAIGFHPPEELGACSKPRILHATETNAAKLLMTPTRNANISGPDLREAHIQIGRYLAMELLPGVLGLTEYSVPHVNGKKTSGHRLCGEDQTTIVAIMRGGEPMAFGINAILPTASFVHAHKPADIPRRHLVTQQTIILVDSVVNNGNTAASFIRHIKMINPMISIVFAAGVVQERATTDERGPLYQALNFGCNCSLIALRLSENKYTGKGGTDTGNRLFNTISFG